MMMKKVTQSVREPAREDCVAMSRFCLSMNLRKAERIVTRHYDAHLAAAGVTAVQLPMLAAITVLRDPSFRSLAEELELDRSTLSRNLALLAERGLVRIDSASGPRAGAIGLTRKGRDTLGRAHNRWLEAHRELEQSLSPQELRKGLAFLGNLREVAPGKERRVKRATRPRGRTAGVGSKAGSSGP
jgi:DNA-binding MarR family transcriptional regulator